MLVVVNGPIGAGKSTFAACLADELRPLGLSVAVVGLDEVVFMIRALPDASIEALWDLGRVAHARLVGGFLRAEVDVVVADGPFHDDRERRLLLDGLTHDVDPVWITLVVPYEEALRRVADDRSRGISKDPAFLRAAYGNFWAGRESLRLAEPALDAAEHSAAELAALVATDLRRASDAADRSDRR